MCSCVYMYLEQDSQVLEQLKMSISEIYLFLFHVFMPLNLFHFASRRFFSAFSPFGGDDPYFPVPLYYIKMYRFSSSLPYQLKNLLKHEGWDLPCHERTKRNFVMPGKKPRSRYSKKRRVSSAGRKYKNPLEVK